MTNDTTDDRPPTDWESVPVDPDPNDDLGYGVRPLRVVPAAGTEDRYVFLPREQDQTASDEFVVVDGDTVASVLDMW